MKWRMALRIATLSEERWSKNITEWNLGLDRNIKTSRSVGRPRKRWEDDISEFLKPEESEESKGNDLKNFGTWKNKGKGTRRTSAKIWSMMSTFTLPVCFCFFDQLFCPMYRIEW